eukprot:7546136-Heterocapsa_arctica.AAC.1
MVRAIIAESNNQFQAMFGQVQGQSQALSAMLNNVNVGQQQAAQQLRADRERREAHGPRGDLDELKA